MILIDTNLLVRVADKEDSKCKTCRDAIRTLRRQGEDLILVPQVLYEFWAVATRQPQNNGLGMGTETASAWLNYFQRQFAVLPDHNLLLQCWHALVKTHQVKSFAAHDARLVAAMQTHGINRVLTLNAVHFAKFPVVTIDPVSI